MKKRHKGLLIILAIIIGLPLVLWLSWLVSTPRPIAVFIMDKTSDTREKIRSRSINWVLTHYRFVKPNGRDYDPQKDYYGFFPGRNQDFTIRDLSRLRPVEINRLAIQYQLAYFSDSYGVHSGESDNLTDTQTTPATQIYGGIHPNDLLFLEYMLTMGRLVIAEFVFLSPPTRIQQRKKAEELLGIRWHGWTGRFFHTLDPGHPDRNFPQWMITLYEKQYNRTWEFTHAGIVFISESEEIVVLEYGNELNTPGLHLSTTPDMRRKYGVAENVNYPGWFDVTLPTSATTKVVSWYEPDLTDAGAELLRENNIPLQIPAVIADYGPNKFYYFSGDFGRNPVKRRFVKFKGAKFAELFLADLNDPTDKSAFFLAFYLPMMHSILKNYHQQLTQN